MATAHVGTPQDFVAPRRATFMHALAFVGGLLNLYS